MNGIEENQTTEFKESWRDEYLKNICAFANSQGGDLYIGIKDDGTPVGISHSKKLMEDIPNKTIQLLGIDVDLHAEKQDGHDILRVRVHQSTVPISYHGRFYIRSGSTIQELQGEKLRNFILKKDNITWDEIGLPQARIQDIDEPVVRKFVSRAVEKNRLYAEAINDSLPSLLNKLNLIDEKGELTRAAILLFGKHPDKYFKTAIIKIGRFGESYSDLVSQDIVEGNLYEMPDKVMELLRIKYLHSLISYKGLERIEQLEYPEKALREAVLNAIIMRSCA
jgi:ATP-dependent DNA helicase RecG